MNMRHLATTTPHPLTHPLFLKLGILSEKVPFYQKKCHFIKLFTSQSSTFFDKMALFHLKHIVIKKVDE